MTAVSIIAAKLSRYERRMILPGSLSYEPRGNLSVFTSMYYSEFIAINNKIYSLER
jgi:hypothetical protein